MYLKIFTLQCMCAMHCIQHYKIVMIFKQLLTNENNNNNNVYLLQRLQVEVYEENHCDHLLEAHNYHTI